MNTQATKNEKEYVLAPFRILYDFREKAPYRFTGIQADACDNYLPMKIDAQKAVLKTGDYTVEGLESRVAIERKSLADLYGTLGQHRERFEREHQRLAAMDFAAVVVEADWYTILNAAPVFSSLSPKTVYRTILSWTMRFGVTWFLMGTRDLAEETTFRLLERFWIGYSVKRN